MAGRSQRKAREAVEARRRAGGGRAKRSTRAERLAAVTRAAQVGDAKAAAEFGVTPGTLRKWRSRLRAEAAPVAVASSSGVGGDEVGDVGAVADMRRALAAARRVEGQAMAQTEALLAAGNPGEARNAAAAAGVMSDKALALGRELASAEASAEREAVRLGEERGSCGGGSLARGSSCWSCRRRRRCCASSLSVRRRDGRLR